MVSYMVVIIAAYSIKYHSPKQLPPVFDRCSDAA